MRFFQSDTRLVGTWHRQNFELGLTCTETFSLPCLYQMLLSLLLLLDLDRQRVLKQKLPWHWASTQRIRQQQLRIDQKQLLQWVQHIFTEYITFSREESSCLHCYVTHAAWYDNDGLGFFQFSFRCCLLLCITSLCLISFFEVKRLQSIEFNTESCCSHTLVLQ